MKTCTKLEEEKDGGDNHKPKVLSGGYVFVQSSDSSSLIEKTLGPGEELIVTLSFTIR